MLNTKMSLYASYLNIFHTFVKAYQNCHTISYSLFTELA